MVLKQYQTSRNYTKYETNTTEKRSLLSSYYITNILQTSAHIDQVEKFKQTITGSQSKKAEISVNIFIGILYFLFLMCIIWSLKTLFVFKYEKNYLLAIAFILYSLNVRYNIIIFNTKTSKKFRHQFALGSVPWNFRKREVIIWRVYWKETFTEVEQMRAKLVLEVHGRAFPLIRMSVSKVARLLRYRPLYLNANQFQRQKFVC